jgi:hypothetical protein
MGCGWRLSSGLRVRSPISSHDFGLPYRAHHSAPGASGKGLARFSGNGYMSLIERSL